MRRPEDVKMEFVRDWARKAESDFRTAQHLFSGGVDYVDGTTFHAQQAAEKYLKAFLVWHQIEISKTHNIEALLKLAETGDAEIPEVLAEATDLTPYGVEYRYPGDYPEATLEDAKHATDLAMLVRSEVLRRLPADTLSEGS